MATDKEPYRMLIVSASGQFSETVRQLGEHCRFEYLRTVSSCGEARRILPEAAFDTLIVNTPLGDEFGCDFAVDMALHTNAGVLLLVKNELYEEVTSRTLNSGVMVLPKPLNRSAFCLCLDLLGDQAVRLRRVMTEQKRLERKNEELRILWRAKCMLMENMQLSENQAHKYIEKQAMDSRKSKCEIAEEILRLYS